MTKWLPVYEYEGLYEVSDMGEVRNATTKKLRVIYLCKESHNELHLTKDKKPTTKRVRRLVMEAFNGHKPYKVIHKNGDITDDRLENLKYDIPAKVTNSLIMKRIKALLKKREYKLGGVADERVIVSVRGDKLVTKAISCYGIIVRNSKDNVVKMKDVKHYKEPTVETLSIALRYYDEKCR